MNTKAMVLFGDSFLANLVEAQMRKLEDAVSNVTVSNRAIGGISTEDGVRQVDLIAKLKPDILVLSFGANDCAPWRTQVPEKNFEKNYDSIIKSFPNSKIIVFPCPPANDPADPIGTKQFNDVLSRYNKIVYNVAENNKAMVIDSPQIYGAILAGGNDYHEEDGLHLNADGYDVFIREVARLV